MIFQKDNKLENRIRRKIYRSKMKDDIIKVSKLDLFNKIGWGRVY